MGKIIILKPKTICLTPFLRPEYFLDMNCLTAFHNEFSRYYTNLLQKDQAFPSLRPQIFSYHWQKDLLFLQ